MATLPMLDMERMQTFALRVVSDFTAVQMGPLSALADRLGLFQALAESGAVTSDEFAQRAGIQERYAREWLSAMACHGYLAYDDGAKRFTLPAEHAFVLTDPASPYSLVGLLRSVLSIAQRGERAMKRAWTIRREGVAHADGQQRWDQAYQLLLRWAVAAPAPQEGVAASGPGWSTVSLVQASRRAWTPVR